jgi:hypothetical protein
MATENSRTQRWHTTPIYTPDFEVASPPALPVHRNPLSTVEVADTHCQITSCHYTLNIMPHRNSAHLWCQIVERKRSCVHDVDSSNLPVLRRSPLFHLNYMRPGSHQWSHHSDIWTLLGFLTTQNPYYFMGLPLRPIDHPGGLPIRVAESMAPGRSARRGSRIVGSPVRSDQSADPEQMSGSAAGFPED